MKTLTSNQKRVLDFIKQHQAEMGTAPTYEAIAKRFGYTTKSTVQHYIGALVEKGYLSKERHLAQSLTLHDHDRRLPLLGKVAAGQPLDYKNHDEKVEVPLSMLQSAGAHFVLQVAGDSMIGEGILDGDFVIVREQKEARSGEIIVAEIDNEATIKRFYKRRTHVELHSANPRYKPIIVRPDQNFRISGVYRGLLRLSPS